MRGWIAVPILLAIVAVGCDGAVHEDYTSPDGRYRVQFPGSPKLTEQTVSTRVGPIVQKIATTEDWSRTARFVSYADYPGGLIHAGNKDPMLDGACQGMASEARLVILSKLPVAINGHPGREISFEGQPGHPAGKISGRARVYVVGTRLYQVVIAGPTGRLTPEATNQFLNSFALLDQGPQSSDVEVASVPSPAPRSPAGFYAIPEPATAALVADTSGSGLGGGDRLPVPGSHDPSTSTHPTASAGGASIRSFEWIDEDADLAGGDGDSAQADGHKDQHLRMALDLPPNTIIDELVVTSNDSDRWVTKPNDRFRPIAIFQRRRPVTRSHVAQVGAYSGSQRFDLYLKTGGAIGPGSPFQLQVVVSIAGNSFVLSSQCKRPEQPSSSLAVAKPPQVVQPPSPSPAPAAPSLTRAPAPAAVAKARPTTRGRESTEVPVLLKPSAAGASITAFEWLDQAEDQVGTSGRTIGPGGGKDEHFRLVLDLPTAAGVEEIAVTGGGVLRWTTKPSTRFGPVAVFAEQRAQIRGQTLRVGTYSGPWTFDLYVESHDTVRRDHVFGVEVVIFVHGNRHSLTARCQRK